MARSSSWADFVFDAVCEGGNVGCVLAVAGDAKAQGAVVGADRDADAHVEGERDVGEDLEHPPAAQVLRLLGAGDVGGDGLETTLRQARQGAGAERDQRGWRQARQLGQLAAGGGLSERLSASSVIVIACRRSTGSYRPTGSSANSADTRLSGIPRASCVRSESGTSVRDRQLGG